MCGIVGIVGSDAVNQEIYDALTALQHRGQDAAGMVTTDGLQLNLCKGNGLVRDVFDPAKMSSLRGSQGIGHVRYPTAGSASSAEAQPMYVNSPYGIALAHNGNLTNTEKLLEELFRDDMRHINTRSDTEVLLNVFAHELQQRRAMQAGPQEIFAAVQGVHERCRGAYSALAVIVGCGMVAFRDPNGIRPLVYGQRERAGKTEYMIASESAALAVQGFELVRDVAPGEALFIDQAGQLHTKVCCEKTKLTPCIFEIVYFARPDSILDDISVYKARLRMGEYLADQVEAYFAEQDHDIDVVIPIPDTGRTAALPMAHRLNVKFREGFVKNRYIGRTFIMPGQTQRKRSVRQKLNVIDLEFKDKNVLLVDDSIVRGTTIRQIIEMAREAGARKVYMASAAPPVRFPNVYGIDMPAAREFIADGCDEREIEASIGADRLFYQRLDDLVASAREGNPQIKEFDCSVFNGQYVTGDIDAGYLQQLSLDRNDQTKQRRDAAIHTNQTVIELHNHA